MSQTLDNPPDLIAQVEHGLVLPVLLATLLFLFSGSAYFINELRAGGTKPTMASGAGATCVYYGRDGLQCWPEFEEQAEAEPQGLLIERAGQAAERLRI